MTTSDIQARLAEINARAAPTIEEVADEWQPIETYPKDGSSFEVLYEDGSIEADVYFSDTRYCMLGAPMGSRGPGLVSTQAGNLPIDPDDGITHWRYEGGAA